MLLERIPLLFLCLTPNIADQDQNLFSKFIQHDYHVKNVRVASVTYNKEFLEDLTVVYRKYNRSTMALNISILTRVDLTRNNDDVEVFRRYGNEFKYFPVRLSYKWCTMFEENMLGFGSNPYGKITCPIKKDVRQSMYNWIPDFSRLPPLIPEGEYMVIANATYKNQYLYNMQYFATVYYKVQIPS